MDKKIPKAMKPPSLKGFLGDAALVGEYLDKQGDLTAVDRFSQVHDQMHVGTSAAPRMESHYRDLLPLEKPKPGWQYSFEVDLDRCTGCKACVTACHNLNGLEEDETWRSVGLIHGVRGKPMQQTVTTACQHCLEPGCSHGCPVKAYEKDKVTGVVKHLDDQCIGCEYCILKCPYDVPQYSKSKGIVRKCDMCIGRLEAGEAPACVQACPTKAIRISLVDQNEVRMHPEAFTAMPGTPDPRYTFPTTRYKTTRTFPEGVEAVDAHALRKEKAHFPLVFMLTLSQLAAGFLLCLEAASIPGIAPAGFQGLRFQAWAHALGAFLVSASIAVSMTHLGRPLYAFRAVIGFRRSWLSREIVAFGILAALSIAVAVGTALPFLLHGANPLYSGMPALEHLARLFAGVGMRLGLSVACLLAVYCSAMVYRDTPRAYWASRLTWFKFLFSAALSGTAAFIAFTACFTAVSGAGYFSIPLYAIAALPCFTVLKLACEAAVQRRADDPDFNPLRKTALLLRGELKAAHNLRFLAALLGGLLLPVLWLYHGFAAPSTWEPAWAGLILLLVAAGECLERYLFFVACVPPRMPGRG